MSTHTEFRGTATSIRPTLEQPGWIGRYHDTDIITVWDDGRIMLDSGGYRTATTKKRLNAASTQFGLGFCVYQKDFAWFVSFDNRPTVPFEDGMVFNRNHA